MYVYLLSHMHNYIYSNIQIILSTKQNWNETKNKQEVTIINKCIKMYEIF